MDVVLVVVWLRTWADGVGFHALHWNMLSWFEVRATVLRGILFGWVGRVVVRGVTPWLG